MFSCSAESQPHPQLLLFCLLGSVAVTDVDATHPPLPQWAPNSSCCLLCGETLPPYPSSPTQSAIFFALSTPTRTPSPDKRMRKAAKQRCELGLFRDGEGEINLTLLPLSSSPPLPLQSSTGLRPPPPLPIQELLKPQST
jgi:hypothetical protein